MFKIIQLNMLLKVLLLLSISLSIAVYEYLRVTFFQDWGIFKLITIGSIISIILVSLLTISFSARSIWKLFRAVNKNLYPDLNGEWVGGIVTYNANGEEELIIDVRAIIRQGLLTTELDMHGKSVKSFTLECTPTIEHGQKKLYYVYRSTPKNPNWPPYDGSTLLDVIDTEDGISLSGKYYTERLKNGRIYLTKISENTRCNVSYY
ncbi:Cap15 family cyclic dinucleotide receptor domain-containing protein [Photobacterium carnosum]|uniref:Cap15 family cyclic dinucleotide receptor domain-containing protein n=1 Tax=Photobacterium carnosum TaxID=2023717 RepID=UPI00128D0438|nr:hypothetical protein [Photobacterium carnosum]KAE8178313.1 hypothetical protein CIT27_00610 [Photobacterium carnosum]